MAKHQADEIRRAIMEEVFWRPGSPVQALAEQFNVTRQGVQKHLADLVRRRFVSRKGRGAHQLYRLRATESNRKTYVLRGLAEHDLYDQMILPSIRDLDVETRDVIAYGCTEMINNAIDHSSGKTVRVGFERTQASVALTVEDDGVGIFRKVAAALDLPNAREAPLELSKGKFTTDPKRHTGVGVFFTSRAFDRFCARANDAVLIHKSREDDWRVVDDDANAATLAVGTRIILELLVPARRSLTELFSGFSSGPDEYRFAKTRVPVKLAQFGDEQLISRSQAKRLLSRVERFDEVLLDFAGVRAIGQAFSDEVFRVFAAAHPNVRVSIANANPHVSAMVRRAKSPS